MRSTSPSFAAICNLRCSSKPNTARPRSGTHRRNLPLYCPRRLNEFGNTLTIPAPLSTVLNTSNRNYQAILTTEPLDTANIVDVPTDLSTPFDYLTNSDTDAGQHRPVQRPSVGIVLQGYRMPQVLERLVLHLYETAGTPRECTDTHTGGTSRAGEGVESQDGLGEKRTEGAQACSGTEWYCVEQRVGCGGIEFSDEICYRLVREIVTFGNSGIEGGNAFMRAKDYSWTIGRR
ncbi:uncharacterized protein K444DRAFT_623160 [Hyaloscypha bicolor E]|uniref:Uncharacterized protein n=1 Tax=Hyaloscypha bicolor E TaxID=1095630 RepID=A0A2J6TV65_9HELO|nr:uncharacterized protein K444DRAFT_623160 [Hyaloscypha bicolor E]PMD66910.1 hypothetical protein K444DRAFT_623160 [Hyaloscypha bicolor E]